MIVFTQTLVVSHDEPKADFYRKTLNKESGWVVKEDTIATAYIKTIRYGEEQEEDESVTCD